jgi:hypothetical protein
LDWIYKSRFPHPLTIRKSRNTDNYLLLPSHFKSFQSACLSLGKFYLINPGFNDPNALLPLPKQKWLLQRHYFQASSRLPQCQESWALATLAPALELWKLVESPLQVLAALQSSQLVSSSQPTLLAWQPSLLMPLRLFPSAPNASLPESAPLMTVPPKTVAV